MKVSCGVCFRFSQLVVHRGKRVQATSVLRGPSKNSMTPRRERESNVKVAEVSPEIRTLSQRKRKIQIYYGDEGFDNRPVQGMMGIREYLSSGQPNLRMTLQQ